MKPTLIIMVGLIGTGKTVLAQALSERLGAAVISSDITRKRLAGILETEHRFEKFNEGIYSPDFTTKTYLEMISVEALKVLGKGDSVIIDASFNEMLLRFAAKVAAQNMGAGFLAIECRLDEDIIKERLANRQDTASDGRWEIYLKQKEVFEPITELLPSEHIVVDTSKSIEEIVVEVLGKIGGLSSTGASVDDEVFFTDYH